MDELMKSKRGTELLYDDYINAWSLYSLFLGSLEMGSTPEEAMEDVKKELRRKRIETFEERNAESVGMMKYFRQDILDGIAQVNRQVNIINAEYEMMTYERFVFIFLQVAEIVCRPEKVVDIRRQLREHRALDEYLGR